MEEHAAWLATQNLPAKPYEHGGGKFEFYIQFYAPTRFRATECFTEGLLSVAAEKGELLLSVTDMVTPYDYEEQLFDRIRFCGAASAPAADSYAHLFAADEIRDSIPMFSLTVGWQWSTYLHMPHTRTVVLNWEGTIFDLWTDDPQVFSDMPQMLQNFELSTTENYRKKNP